MGCSRLSSGRSTAVIAIAQVSQRKRGIRFPVLRLEVRSDRNSDIRIQGSNGVGGFAGGFASGGGDDDDDNDENGDADNDEDQMSAGWLIRRSEEVG